MTAPASLDRVYAALMRHQPPVAYSDLDSAKPSRELKCVAWALGRVVDYWDTLLPALLLEDPSLADRWEQMLGLGAHPSEDLAVRRSRVLPVVRRRLAYSRARLSSVLAPLLGIEPAQVQWIEMVRADIEDAIRFEKAYTGGRTIQVGASPGFTFLVDVPWPSVVDDVGVELRLGITSADASDITVELVHANGASWTAWNGAPGSLNGITLWERAAFRGLPARGPWLLRISNSGIHGAATVDSFALMASNESDTDQIYFGYCLRDVALGVTTDIAVAQRQLEAGGIAHTLGRVIERAMVLCDDPHSLCDREPVGG